MIAACMNNSNVTYLVFDTMLAAMKSGRGWLPFFLLKDLGLALAPKMCPDQSQTFEEVNNRWTFTVGRKKMTHFFSEPAASRCSKTYLYEFSRKSSKN